MDYSHILALIDRYIDILQEARRILVQDRSSMGARPAPARKKLTMRPVPGLSPESDSAIQKREISKGPASARKQPLISTPKRNTTRQVSIPAQIALSGNVPLKPVVVSPREVQLEAARRMAVRKSDAATTAIAAIDEARLADALRKQWQGGLGNLIARGVGSSVLNQGGTIGPSSWTEILSLLKGEDPNSELQIAPIENGSQKRRRESSEGNKVARTNLPKRQNEIQEVLSIELQMR